MGAATLAQEGINLLKNAHIPMKRETSLGQVEGGNWRKAFVRAKSMETPCKETLYPKNDI